MTPMDLQLALDMVTMDEALRLLELVGSWVDIVEVGTPWIMREGMAPVRELKRRYPRLRVLADLKIMDAGRHEAEIGFEAGADLVTVLGVADAVTVAGVMQAAHAAKRPVMADLINVADIPATAALLQDAGVQYLCVHTAFDLQAHGHDPLEELRQLMPVLRTSQAAVAGGVKPATVDAIAALGPAVVVVGGAITGAGDPADVARRMKAAMAAHDAGRNQA